MKRIRCWKRILALDRIEMSAENSMPIIPVVGQLIKQTSNQTAINGLAELLPFQSLRSRNSKKLLSFLSRYGNEPEFVWNNMASQDKEPRSTSNDLSVSLQFNKFKGNTGYSAESSSLSGISESKVNDKSYTISPQETRADSSSSKREEVTGLRHSLRNKDINKELPRNSIRNDLSISRQYELLPVFLKKKSTTGSNFSTATATDSEKGKSQLSPISDKNLSLGNTRITRNNSQQENSRVSQSEMGSNEIDDPILPMTPLNWRRSPMSKSLGQISGVGLFAGNRNNNHKRMTASNDLNDKNTSNMPDVLGQYRSWSSLNGENVNNSNKAGSNFLPFAGSQQEYPMKQKMSEHGLANNLPYRAASNHNLGKTNQASKEQGDLAKQIANVVEEKIGKAFQAKKYKQEADSQQQFLKVEESIKTTLKPENMVSEQFINVLVKRLNKRIRENRFRSGLVS